MKFRSWPLDRRTALKGMSATIALPLLDAMNWGRNAEAGTVIANSKRRFCAIQFPFGVPAPPDGHRLEQWSWYPKERNGSHEFREILSPLNDLKEDVSILRGLSHTRNMRGHETAGAFLTGTPANSGPGRNTISVDQVLADAFGDETRFESLVLGLDGGVGTPGRSNTLSYNRNGLPIPAQSNLRRIFDSMFSVTAQKQRKTELAADKSILDDVLESARTLKDKVGKRDRAKLDEYLSSIRQLEQRIQREEAWFGQQLPSIDESKLTLSATLADPANYLESMFDLIFLAFQTDMTRCATFQVGNQNPADSTAELTLKLGMRRQQHGLAHNMNKDNGAAEYGAYLKRLTDFVAAFLKRMKATEEGTGTMLDHTLTLYGSSNGSRGTHSCRDLPLVLAGGEAIGIKQGQYLKFGQDVPLTNLYATMLDTLGAPQKAFADSTGQISVLRKG